MSQVSSLRPGVSRATLCGCHFWKSENFLKICKFSKNLKFFRKSDIFRRYKHFLKISRNLKFFQCKISIVTKLPTWQVLCVYCTWFHTDQFLKVLLPLMIAVYLQYTSLLPSTYITIADCYLLTPQLLACLLFVATAQLNLLR